MHENSIINALHWHIFTLYINVTIFQSHNSHYGHYQSSGYNGHGLYYRNRYECFGGCPIGAFCDFGMCRCRSGYEERYGGCWNRADDFNNRYEKMMSKKIG